MIMAKKMAKKIEAAVMNVRRRFRHKFRHAILIISFIRLKLLFSIVTHGTRMVSHLHV